MTAATAGAGRYEVLGQLATGGMGEILLARRRGPAGFERLVVLKRALGAARASRDVAAALIEEARLLARINHANVCQLHDLDEADGQYFLALELLEGLPLWTILTCARASRRPIDPRAICGMFEQICDGLDAIHQLRTLDGKPAGVVHRDLSPGNLFVTESGTVKILDLGIAKTAASEEQTPHGTIKGKLPYVAPEQAAGKPVDARTDLFALGLVLYDTARGSPPPSYRVGALACDDLELDDLPPPLARVIHRAVRRDPAERFGSAAELAVAIRAAGHELGGALGRAELALWLQRDFADELAAQRARTRAALAEGAEPSVTRTLTLRSVLLPSIDVDDEVPAAAPPPPPRPRATERLPAEDDEPPAAARPLPGGRATEPLATGATGDDEATEVRAIDGDGGEPTGQALAVAESTPPSRRAAVPTARRSRAALAIIGGAALVAALTAAVVSRAPGGSGALPATPIASAGAATPRAGDRAPIAETRSAPAEDGAPSAGSAPSTTSAPDAARAAPPPRPATPSHLLGAPRQRPAATVQPAPAPGLITIGSMPWADVWIGDRKLRTDVWRAELPPGRHTLRARTSDGREQVRTFAVTSGKETRLVLDWSAR
jgi:serine/threonine-protein kinase